MLKARTIIFFTCCVIAAQCSSNVQQEVRKFPKDFMFGSATASYQIEGSWNVDGKGESMWDHYTHKNPSPVLDGTNGDIAADSYRLYKRDIEMMRELGLDFYRFSLSWTRILSGSFPNEINQAGVEHYNNVIDELLKYNITPMITLYHWDLPQKLMDMGGWTNPHIVDWYADYARVAFELFGDKVKHWITMNEPKEICDLGYGSALLAPLFNYSGYADYLCGRNLLMAHAKAYHIYDQEFRPTQKGNIFITLSSDSYEAESAIHEEAAAETLQFELGQYAHPIFSKTGDYPEIMKQKIAKKSAEQGFFRSRLPVLTPEEIEFIRGTSDFFGLNHYSTQLVYRNESVVDYHAKPSYNDDMDVIIYQPDEWLIGESKFTKYAPRGFYNILKYITEEYNKPPIFITENGFATHGGLDDDDRDTYYKGYLNSVLDAIEDGCNVIGYTAWSLMDNFQWMLGLTEKFGLYEVDFDSPERTRTPRKSAFVYKEVIRTRSLDLNYEPTTTVMTIDEGN